MSLRHADEPVRRLCLRHAAVRAGVRSVGHARPHEFRQSRPWLLRHGRRLHHDRVRQPPGAAVLGRTRARLFSHRSDRRRAGAPALRPRLHQKPFGPGAVHHRARLHVGRRGRFHDGIVAAIHSDPRGAQRPVRCVWRRRRSLSAADHRGVRAVDAGAAACADVAPGSAAGCALRSTTSGWRAASAST